MQPQDDFGMEMLWKFEQKNVHTKSDLMVLLVHWYLVRNGFRNVGVGDDKTLDRSAEQSELLPEGWNENFTSYALRYALKNELYNLHGTLSNETMIINLLHAKSLQVSNVVFNLNTIVKSIRGNKMKDLFDNVDEQIARLENELMKPIHGGPSKNSSTQTAATSSQSSCARHSFSAGVLGVPTGMPFPNYGLVGSADRDPLGALGGGMLMDPLRPRMPHAGMFMPRPRIDPMGPIPNRINQNPNPDHLPPPGYNDMFM